MSPLIYNGNNNDEGFGIALDPAVNIYVFGQSSSAVTMDLAVWKCSSSGELMGE